jgi:hypothetical protein
MATNTYIEIYFFYISLMNYKQYVKYLKSNNIILFDHDYRISFYNINNYMNLSKEMTGGGGNINKLLYDKKELEMIVNIALSSNPQYLLNLTKH